MLLQGIQAGDVSPDYQNSKTEAVNVMQYLWTGSWPENRAPAIKALKIDGKAARENISLQARTSHRAWVDVTDPEGDSLTFHWEILPEPGKFGYGGRGERKPRALPELITRANGAELSFSAPRGEGSYRLFVTVLDGKGNAAAANIPFHVEPEE